jgi:hypothetical protein
MHTYTIVGSKEPSKTHLRIGDALPVEGGVKVPVKFGRRTENGAFLRRSIQWIELSADKLKGGEHNVADVIAKKLGVRLAELHGNSEAPQSSQEENTESESSPELDGAGSAPAPEPIPEPVEEPKKSAKKRNIRKKSNKK